MATILENKTGRRTIRLTTDDVISIIREYQNITNGIKNYEEIRTKLSTTNFYLPEDMPM